MTRRSRARRAGALPSLHERARRAAWFLTGCRRPTVPITTALVARRMRQGDPPGSLAPAAERVRYRRRCRSAGSALAATPTVSLELVLDVARHGDVT